MSFRHRGCRLESGDTAGARVDLGAARRRWPISSDARGKMMTREEIINASVDMLYLYWDRYNQMPLREHFRNALVNSISEILPKKSYEEQWAEEWEQYKNE